MQNTFSINNHNEKLKRTVTNPRPNNMNDHEVKLPLLPPVPRLPPSPSSSSPWKGSLMRQFKEMPEAELEMMFMALCSADTNLATPKQLVSLLLELVQDETMRKLIVDSGAIQALVRHLRVPPDGQYAALPPVGLDADALDLYVEAVSAHTLSILADNRLGYQKLIIDAGALPPLVDLLKRTQGGPNSPAMTFLLRGLINSIVFLANDNDRIKTLVRVEGGIPPLVKLLWSDDENVRGDAVWALAILGMDSIENKNQIIHNSKILDRLILMLRSKDNVVQGGVVCLIGILVESYPYIKSRVIDEALQLVIGILSSSSSSTQRRAAILIGVLADASSNCKVHIAQRGAIPPLIEMLRSSDAQTRKESAFTLCKLAEDIQNQAGIAQCGGILPLLELLHSNVELTKRYAVLALCMVVQNEDTIVGFIEMGCFQKLLGNEFTHQSTQDVITYTLKSLEKKIRGRVLSHLLHLIPDAEAEIRRRVFVALAHLSSPDDYKTIFIDYGGLELLFDLMKSTNIQNRREASLGLSKLVDKSILFKTKVVPAAQSGVYPGEVYIDNPYLADVTFLVKGKQLFAHTSCLIESSDAFRAMFEGEYAETNAEEIVIPNIGFKVFKLMMRYIYTGTVEVNTSIAYPLLKAADQYLLFGLKRLCENVIAQDITLDTVPILMEFSETFRASYLRRSCIRFILEQFDVVRVAPWYSSVIQVVLAETHSFLVRELSNANQDETRKVEH